MSIHDDDDSLVTQLTLAAQAQARVALEAIGSSKPALTQGLIAALAAGAAIEMALKAVIASILPTLLAERGDAHSQLFLAGKGGLSGKDQESVRTIGAVAARDLLVKARPRVTLTTNDMDAALVIRNTAAHLGSVDSDRLADGIRSMVLCLSQLLPELHLAPGDFWGPELEGLAAALVSEIQEERVIRVQQARARALIRLARLKDLAPEAFEAIVETLDRSGEDPEEDDYDYGRPHECPVCRYGGWLSGVVERSDLLTDEEDRCAAWVERTFVPTHFSCDVCELRINRSDLGVADLPTEEHLEDDEDPWELSALYEQAREDEYLEKMRSAR